MKDVYTGTMITNPLNRFVAGVIALLVLSTATLAAPKGGGTDPFLPGNTVQEEQDPVTASVMISADNIPAGGRAAIAVIINHAKGWHIQPHSGGGSGALEGFISIPTTIDMVEPVPEIMHLGPIQWPPTHMAKVSFTGEEVSIPVYEGKAIAYIPFVVANDAQPGEYTTQIKLRYQACNEETCIRPQSFTFNVKFNVVATGAAADTGLDSGVFSNLDQSVFTGSDKWSNTIAVAGAGKATISTESAGTESNSAADEKTGLSKKYDLSAWGIGLWVVGLIIFADMIWMIFSTFRITKKTGLRTLVTIIGIAIMALTFVTVRSFTRPGDLNWKEFSYEAFEQAREEGKIIVIDFTADWCVNCKMIEATTLRNPKVVKALNRPDVVALHADLTSETAIGWKKLNELGPGGIPRTAVYHPGREPIQWKSFYTADALLEALSNPDEAGGAPKAAGKSEFDFFGMKFTVSGGSWALVLIIAAVAGLILNFTPCVLPVIPIKVLSLHQQAGNPRRCFALGMSFGLGIVAFFAAIAVPIVLIRVGAAPALDWGQIFGYWWLNLIIGLIIAGMALGMMGLFTIRLPQKAYMFNPSHDTHAGSFMTGFFTGLLSTPCTGPLLGATIAWIVTQPPWLGMATFIVMGLGMAIPYVILAANPKWVDRLPHSGPGSELVKQVMGLLLIAVAVYFLTLAVSAYGGGSGSEANPAASIINVLQTGAHTFLT